MKWFLSIFKGVFEELTGRESGACEQCAGIRQFAEDIRGEIDHLFGDGAVAMEDAI